MPKFHFGYVRTSQELFFHFEQIRKEKLIAKYVLVAEPWQKRLPAKGHRQREVWQLMHGKMCLRTFSRKQGSFKYSWFITPTKCFLPKGRIERETRSAHCLRNQIISCKPMVCWYSPFTAMGEVFLCVGRNEWNKYLKIAYYTTCKWRCLGRDMTDAKYLICVFIQQQSSGKCLRKTEHTFFCIFNSSLGSHCFLRDPLGLWLSPNVLHWKRPQVFEDMNGIVLYTEVNGIQGKNNKRSNWQFWGKSELLDKRTKVWILHNGNNVLIREAEVEGVQTDHTAITNMSVEIRYKSNGGYEGKWMLFGCPSARVRAELVSGAAWAETAKKCARMVLTKCAIQSTTPRCLP